MDSGCPIQLKIKSEPIEDIPEDICFEDQWLSNLPEGVKESPLQNDVNVIFRNQNKGCQISNYGSDQRYMESNCQDKLEIKAENVEEPPTTVEFGPNWLSYKLKEEKEDNSNDSYSPDEISTHLESNIKQLQNPKMFQGFSVNEYDNPLPSTAGSDANRDQKYIIPNRKKFTDGIFEHRTRRKSHSCHACSERLLESGSNLTKHVRAHTKEKPYSCYICNKAFAISSLLKRHLMVHTKEKPYPCKVCKKAFSSSSYLKAHLRTHTKEKPYLCNMCDKAFSQSIYLKVHLRTHTKEKPFSCKLCNKAFSQSTTLKEHLRTHTKEKPYSCTFCEKAFSGSSNLTQHLRIHTKEKPYSCYVCDKAFSSSSHLKAHIRTHTKERPFPCTVCVKAFSSSSHLKTHLRRMHTKPTSL